MVLGWLNMSPARLKTFVANKVGQISQKVPSNQWRYVATESNPADLASRGTSPQELLQALMWPPWLKLSPEVWPRSPDINRSRELPKIKAKVLVVSTVDTPPWTNFSSYDWLLRTVAWCRRFMRNCQCQERELGPLLMHSCQSPKKIFRDRKPHPLDHTLFLLTLSLY